MQGQIETAAGQMTVATGQTVTVRNGTKSARLQRILLENNTVTSPPWSMAQMRWAKR